MMVQEWSVIDFSIGQNGLNEDFKDVICIFEVFRKQKLGNCSGLCSSNKEAKNTRLV